MRKSRAGRTGGSWYGSYDLRYADPTGAGGVRYMGGMTNKAGAIRHARQMVDRGEAEWAEVLTDRLREGGGQVIARFNRKARAMKKSSAQLEREVAEVIAGKVHSVKKAALTRAQRIVLGNIIARGGVSEHDLHMGRMAKGDVRRSVANKLVQMGLVTVEPLWVDVHYGRTRLLPAQTLHQRVNHYYATSAGYVAYGDEPARLG